MTALTLNPEEIRSIADAHEEARRSATPIRRVTLDHPSMTIDDAYACQADWVGLQMANGAELRGHKIGLTSRAMQSAMGIDEPDYGALLDYMFHENQSAIRRDQFLDLRLEVEIAFILGEDISTAKPVTPESVLSATASIVAAVELIDARSFRVDPDDGVARTVRDTIADNAANAGVVLGDRHLSAAGRELRWLAAICKRNGTVEETGLAAGVLDDPVMGVVWLAQKYEHHGVGLEAGQVVLAGSFTRPLDCRPGDVFEVDYGVLGTIELEFV